MTKLTVRALQKTLKASLGRLDGSRRALMFSGGFDSMLMALLAKRYGARVTAVTVQFEDFNPHTVREATRLAKKLHLPHHILQVTVPEFVSSFGSLSAVIDKPVLDLDLALVHAAFKKYDSKIAGKVFISAMGSDQWFGDQASEQTTIDEAVHHKVAKAYGYKFIFPFLSAEMKALSQKVPSTFKKNKKLLRLMVSDNDLDFLSKQNGKREIQVPAQVRRLLVRVYNADKSGKADDKALRKVAEGLWLKKSRNRSLTG